MPNKIKYLFHHELLQLLHPLTKGIRGCRLRLSSSPQKLEREGRFFGDTPINKQF